MTIRGENVYLRALEKEDLKAIHRWQNDADYMRLDSYDPAHVVSMAGLEKRFADDLESKDKSRKAFIIGKSDGDTAIGMASFRKWTGKRQRVEIGLSIGEKNERGKGYGTEALDLLIKFLFEELNVHRIEMETLADNEAAIAMSKKCGFEEEGRKRDAAFFDGQFHDVLIMAQLKK